MKPIIFNTEMVRAIMDGRKTQTRRLVKNAIPFAVGDVLYVRETWAAVGCIGWEIDQFEYNYKADYINGKWTGYADMCFGGWKPSIHMPKEAARLFLKITGIEVQRLQDISEKDAVAEGCADGAPTQQFAKLWDSIYGFKTPWDSNPWVWVISFEKL